MRMATVIVFAKDVARMRAFYGDVLGLGVIEDSPGWVRLDAGGCTLALHAIPEAIARRIVIADPPEAREDTAIKVAFHVADVAAERARLVAAGAHMFPAENVRRAQPVRRRRSRGERVPDLLAGVGAFHRCRTRSSSSAK